MKLGTIVASSGNKLGGWEALAQSTRIGTLVLARKGAHVVRMTLRHWDVSWLSVVSFSYDLIALVTSCYIDFKQKKIQKLTKLIFEKIGCKKFSNL